MDDYRSIADHLAAEIIAGRLMPGERLPPQRQFARQRGIAASTASRVYGELVRRGLAVGEVGRGTFIRTGSPRPSPALAEPGTARVDLELNFPALPDEPERLAQGLARLLRGGGMGEALRPVGAVGTPAAREAAAALLARAGWRPGPERVLFAGSGRQAIAGAIAALVPTGGRLGVEALTYPVVKGIAARLGVELVPLATDDDGLVPEALASAASGGGASGGGVGGAASGDTGPADPAVAGPAAGPRAAAGAWPRLHAVYLQPALHNPLGATMSAARRAALVEVLRRHELTAIEDAIYGFLREDLPPLAALAPERVVVVDSLSKRLSPGLTLGFAVAPEPLVGGLAAALRSGAWTAPRFALDAATEWITDGTAAAIQEAKRVDAVSRQRLAAQRLAGLDVRADPHAYHCWWTLPEPWRAETFVAAAARLDIAVTPAAAFTVGRGHAPNAVRLALSAPPVDALADALGVLAALARRSPEDVGPE
ncbi:aminotransferase-like domain-containing protein [Streptomyces sp. 4N509B]|uniref:aminotransferase-like domain-containing protein n=1 Tax=Streptomyces sp. 4N509B TaxID=3457413 RepID=UPI003FD568B0